MINKVDKFEQIMIDIETCPQHELEAYNGMTGKDMTAYINQTEEFTIKNLPFLKNLSQILNQYSERQLHQTLNQTEFENEVKEFQKNVCNNGNKGYF